MKHRQFEAIVLGASAGGLNAFTVLFERLPEKYPVPVVAVQHRSRDQYRDLLEEVLQQKCRIRIKQADEKEKLLPGFVYVAPPGYHLMIDESKRFSLSTWDPVKFGCPSIDVLFETAASQFRESLAGILLTGANDDGAEGLKAIRHSGGKTVAQDPREAAYPMMPEAAIKRGYVDHVWPLIRIRDFLLNEV